MRASTELESQFHLLMRSIYDRAKKERGSNATRFMKMLQDHGGVETAHILLRSPTVSDGFVELHRHRRLDLTLEAQVLSHPELWPLFDDRELDVARRRLKECGWTA